MSGAVRIRAAHPGDAAALAAIYRPYVLDTVATFETEPPDAAAMTMRMLAAPRMPWLVTESGERVLGYAYASRHRDRTAYRWSADVSIYVAMEERGRGIGRALYAELIPLVRGLGYVNLYAGITLPNDASVALHAAVGFELVGVYRFVGFKAGRWLDVGWYVALADEFPAPPGEPVPWVPPIAPIPGNPAGQPEELRHTDP